MAGGLLIARLALAAVFFLAGAAKLFDRAGSRAAIVGFGLPPSVAAPLGVALPLVELVLAIALLPAASANWGGLGALILLGLFIVGIANVLVRGREAHCHCFGQLHSSPVGWSTLGRNVVLSLIAAFVLVGQRGRPAPSYLDWFAGFGTVEWVALSAAGFAVALLAAGTWFGMHLMRQHGRILLRLDALEKELAERGLISAPRGVTAPTPDGLPVGAPAPAFDAADLQGSSTSLDELLSPGLPVMLVFTHPRCTPCTAVLPEIAGWQDAHGAKLTVGLISQGTLEENRVGFAEAGIRRVLVQRAREIADAYGAYTTPSAVLISREGTVATAIAHGAVAIRALVRSIVHGPVTNPHLSGVDNGTRRGARPPQDREKDLSTPLVSFDAR
jgi:peroxiredoxin